MAKKIVQCSSCEAKLSIDSDKAKIKLFACPVCKDVIDTSESSKPAGSTKRKKGSFNDIADVPPIRSRRRSSSRVSEDWIAPVAILGSVGIGFLIVLVLVTNLRSMFPSLTTVAEKSTSVTSNSTAGDPNKVGTNSPQRFMPTQKPGTNIGPNANPGSDPQQLTPAQLDELKAATVYVKLPESVGSGFVVAVIGRRCRIVTNRHVVDEANLSFRSRSDDSDDDPSDKGGGKKKRSPPTRPRGRSLADLPKHLLNIEEFGSVGLGIAREAEIVFRAGTPKQQKRIGKIVYADREVDLALIEVEGVENPPKPIQIAEKFELRELQPVVALGFPFGDNYSERNTNTAITVTSGKVSSIRYGPGGIRDSVHFDANINPGNSGGPLVNMQQQLVGVNTLLEVKTRIGIALAHTKVVAMLRPQITAFRVGTRLFGETVVGPIATRALMINGGKWEEIALSYSQVRTGNPRDILGKEKGAKFIKLKLGEGSATGSIQYESLDPDLPLYCQVVGSTVDGRVSRTRSRLTTFRVAGPRTGTDLKGSGSDLEFSKKSRDQLPVAFKSYVAEYSDYRDLLGRFSKRKRGTSNSFITGLGAKVQFPDDEDGPIIGVIGNDVVQTIRVAFCGGAKPNENGQVFLAGSLHISGESITGFRQSDIVLILSEMIKESIGPIVEDEEFTFDNKVEGRRLKVAPIERAGGFDPEDPPSAQIAFSAARSTIHFAAVVSLNSRAANESASAAFLESFEPCKPGIPVLPTDMVMLRLLHRD